LGKGRTGGGIGGGFGKGILSGHEGGETGDGVCVDETVADLGEFLSTLIFYSLEVRDESLECVDTLGPVAKAVDVGRKVVVVELK
jgi:hypothetical protein